MVFQRPQSLFSLILISVHFYDSTAFKPVILMHGILAKTTELLDQKEFIEKNDRLRNPVTGFVDDRNGGYSGQAAKKAHPGTNVTIIDGYNNLKSLFPMWKQVDSIQIQMEAIFRDHPQGVHLICFSQGGLICRAVLSRIEHNVQTFVSLSSPQSGQYGDTAYLKYLFPTYLKHNIYRFFYTSKGQKWSVANYWNDPHEQALYLNESVFLPVLNNQSYNPKSQDFKNNFSLLKNLVLIGGPDDGVITPWQSSHFAFYDKNEKVVEMKQQQWYIEDSFGLKTLDKRRSIHRYEIAGVQHVHWHKNQTVFNCCILPWLD